MTAVAPPLTSRLPVLPVNATLPVPPTVPILNNVLPTPSVRPLLTWIVCVAAAPPPFVKLRLLMVKFASTMLVTVPAPATLVLLKMMSAPVGELLGFQFESVDQEPAFTPLPTKVQLCAV